jgi:hypothetical protein
VSGQGGEIKVQLSSGDSLVFRGFSKKDKEVVEKYLTEVGIKLDTRSTAVNGRNWGDISFDGWLLTLPCFS